MRGSHYDCFVQLWRYKFSYGSNTYVDDDDDFVTIC